VEEERKQDYVTDVDHFHHQSEGYTILQSISQSATTTQIIAPYFCLSLEYIERPGGPFFSPLYPCRTALFR